MIMIKKKYKIIYYTSKNESKEAFEASILCQKVKLVAWLKRDAYSGRNGITILNEGCIPIPDWVKNDNK